jgi:hypothetical protein
MATPARVCEVQVAYTVLSHSHSRAVVSAARISGRKRLTPLLQRPWCMHGHKNDLAGTAHGDEDRGFPLEENDELPPAGETEIDDGPEDLSDRDLDPGWEDGDPADRRRDPLRRP